MKKNVCESSRVFWPLISMLVISACAMTLPTTSTGSTKAQVFAAERDFAQTMAQRDKTRFAQFISDEAIFFNGATAHRGKAKVIEEWSKYFDTPNAPFSWEPDQVEVLDSGTLALSSGPVRDPAGKVFARFNSIWRLEAPGQWRVVFDKGSPAGQ